MDVGSTKDGYYVGWMRIDEYLRFTVDVTADGMRRIALLNGPYAAPWKQRTDVGRAGVIRHFTNSLTGLTA